MVLTFNNKIKDLEKQKKWSEAVEFLYVEWEKDKKNFNNYLCLGTEVWYVLVYYIRMRIEDIGYEWLTHKLQDIASYGFENFQNHNYFNAIFGYMIYMTPHAFLKRFTSAAYEEWQNKGKEMMKIAYLEEKTNPFIATLYFHSIGDEEKMKEASSLFAQNIKDFFSEDEEVGSYFVRVFSP